MEELAAKLQGKKPEAPAAVADPSAEAAAGGAPAAAGGRETEAAAVNAAVNDRAVPEDAKKASERAPLKSNPSTYLGAISAANRNVRLMADDLPWKKSVQLFEAEQGRKPRDTKEFLDRVRSEGTKLPDITLKELLLVFK